MVERRKIAHIYIWTLLYINCVMKHAQRLIFPLKAKTHPLTLCNVKLFYRNWWNYIAIDNVRRIRSPTYFHIHIDYYLRYIIVFLRHIKLSYKDFVFLFSFQIHIEMFTDTLLHCFLQSIRIKFKKMKEKNAFINLFIWIYLKIIFNHF